MNKQCNDPAYQRESIHAKHGGSVGWDVVEKGVNWGDKSSISA